MVDKHMTSNKCNKASFDRATDFSPFVYKDLVFCTMSLVYKNEDFV
jgi:hypothetical protein